MTTSNPTTHPTSTATSAARSRATDPTYQAFLLLRTVFTVAPIVFGLDKFTNVLTDWTQYLAPWINDLVPGDASQAMYVVGRGRDPRRGAVAVAPRIGAWVVAAWLAGIIVDLLTLSGFYDVALRDFGLLVAAVALARLAAGAPVSTSSVTLSPRRPPTPGHRHRAAAERAVHDLLSAPGEGPGVAPPGATPRAGWPAAFAELLTPRSST